MLDCGLNMQSVLHFMPMPMVPSAKFNSLPSWLPRDNHQDWQIEGVRLFIYFLEYNYAIIIYKLTLMLNIHFSGIERMLWQSVCRLNP